MSLELPLLALLVVYAVARLVPPDQMFRVLRKNERVKKVCGIVKDNVRLMDPIKGVSYVPLSITHLPNDRFLLEMEPENPPFNLVIEEFSVDDMRFDIREIIGGDGMVRCRIVKDYIPPPLPTNALPENCATAEYPVSMGPYDEAAHPMYTPYEIKVMSERNKRERDDLEGQLVQAQANVEQKVQMYMQRVNETISAKKQPISNGGNK